jgi:quercetin dioxygenase-like cupin family protein
MLRNFIFMLVLLSFAVWLGQPLMGSSSNLLTRVGYDVVVQTSDQGRTFVVRDTTIKPGGSIGWHSHRGTAIAVVKEGTLYHYGSDCGVDAVYGAGDSFIEPSGSAHVHDGRNFGTTPVVIEVLYVIPAGTPLADAQNPPPACAG